MNYENVLLEQIEAGIYLLTVNRPKALNALNSSTLDEIGAAAAEAGADPDARVLLVTGAGDNNLRHRAQLKIEAAQHLRHAGWVLPQQSGMGSQGALRFLQQLLHHAPKLERSVVRKRLSDPNQFLHCQGSMFVHRHLCPIP